MTPAGGELPGVAPGGPVVLFAAATTVLLLAHIVRAARHSYFFARGDLPERFDLLFALTLSYALNTLVPLRLGEVARALFIAVRLRLRVGYVLATIAAERLADVVVVALISAGLAAAAVGGRPAGAVLRLNAALLLAAAAVIAGAVALRRSAPARRAVWLVASVFNDTIRHGVVEFVSTTADLIVAGPYRTGRFLATTAGMWALYLTAFAMFAASVRGTLAQVSFALLGAPLRPLLTEALAGGVSGATIALLLFTTIPVVAVVAYGIVRNRREFARSIRFVRHFGLAPADVARVPVSRRFRDTRDYAAFLQAHYSTADQLVASFIAESGDDVVVHRLLPGGSDAVTAVVESQGVLTIRKLAAGGAGKKLGTQASWLRRHADALPLPAVVGDAQYADRYHFDMPFTLTARDFYDVIHTAPFEASWRVLREVVECVSGFHRAHARSEAPAAVVDAYLEQKVRTNAREVLAYAREALGEHFTINGEPYDLAEWDRLLDLDFLRAQVVRRDMAVVHGDLTIENIIVCPERPSGWYLIDPNPENVFDTPLIDWAKLMQSLDLGYEGLNRGLGAAVARDGAVQLAFTKSNAYARLESSLAGILGERLGTDGMREVAFHELVNYLRLTPYKLRHAPQKGLTFFACTAVLLRRYGRLARG